jgi:hypothetical protein
MTNRIFAQPESHPTVPNSERPINFHYEQHFAFAADLDRQLLELEQIHAVNPCDCSIPQQRTSTAASTARVEVEPCRFDDFGLVQGLEIDVRWL